MSIRKLQLFALSFVLLCSSVLWTGFAEESISFEEAKKLVQSATDLRKSFVDGYARVEDYADRNLETDIFQHYESWSEPLGETVSFSIRYRQVTDGCSQSEMRQKIRDTFTEELAKKCEESSFFRDYITVDGKDYFRFNRGAQVTPAVSSIYYTEEELDTFHLISENVGVLTAKYNSIWSPYRSGDVEVFFTFAKENGAWKISEFDESQVSFRQWNRADAMTELDEESVQIALSAVVNDLYFFTETGGCDLLQAVYGWSYLGQAWADTGGIISVLGDEARWREYAEKYCQPEIANRLLENKRHFVIQNGRVYSRIGISSLIIVENIFGDTRFNADEIRFLDVTEDRATIEFTFHYPEYAEDKISQFPYETLGWKTKPLTVEFQKVGTGWKISGGDFLDGLDAYFFPLVGSYDPNEKLPGEEPEEQPDTGDNFLLPGLAAAALLVLPLMRKKRKIAG